MQAAKQKIDGDKAVPILLVERFVTYKEGEEQTRHAEGKNLSLFAGFRFSLDLGQVVPEALGGDLRFVVDGDKVYAEPVGKAKLYLVTKHDPAVVPKKAGKFVMGNKFDPKYFAGAFKLHDDGRRSGKLILKVDDDGGVTGAYYSDKDGQKYDVQGKIGSPQHPSSSASSSRAPSRSSGACCSPATARPSPAPRAWPNARRRSTPCGSRSERQTAPAARTTKITSRREEAVVSRTPSPVLSCTGGAGAKRPWSAVDAPSMKRAGAPRRASLCASS